MRQQRDGSGTEGGPARRAKARSTTQLVQQGRVPPGGGSRRASNGTLLMRRLADSPALPALVAQLEPRALHGLIAMVGIGDAAPLMALASPEKLAATLDLAVWSSPRHGAAETFDARAFTDWLEAWLGIGETFAAERLLALGEEYLGTAFASLVEVQSIHVRGFEGGYGWKLEKRFDDDPDHSDRDGFDTRSAEELLHDARWLGDDLDERLRTSADRPRDEADDLDRDTRLWAEASPASTSPTDQAFYGEFIVGGLVSDEWELVQSALNALWSHDPDALLAMLGRLAANPSMLAMGDHRSVLRDDVAQARELAQVAAGYVTPTGARAFFAGITASSLDALCEAGAYDSETAQHFLRTQAAARAAQASAVSPDTDALAAPDAAPAAANERHVGEQEEAAAARAIAAELAELQQAIAAEGIVRAITPPSVTPRLAASSHAARADVRAAIDALAATHPEAASRCLQELAYLANTVVTGVQRAGHALAEADAAPLVLATANLGLDWLAARDPAGARTALHAEPGVVRLFGVGWHLLQSLPAQVVAACARGLANPGNARLLARNTWLRGEVQAGLLDLQRCVAAGEHGNARDALTLLSLVLDADACRQLRAVLDDVPCMPDADADDGSRWIDSAADLQHIDSWLHRLA